MGPQNVSVVPLDEIREYLFKCISWHKPGLNDLNCMYVVLFCIQDPFPDSGYDSMLADSILDGPDPSPLDSEVDIDLLNARGKSIMIFTQITKCVWYENRR